MTIQVLDKASLLQDGTDISSAEKDNEEREGTVLVQKLPNQLLGQEEEEEEGSMEPVVLVTEERETYRCVLPNTAHGGSSEVSYAPNSGIISPGIPGADVGERREICCQNLPRGVGT